MTAIATKRKQHDEEEIRARVDSWTKALRAKDIEGVMAHYAPEMLDSRLAAKSC